MALIHVAVGVIVDSRRRVLIALRQQHLHQGGLWEFPGGKFEANESAREALERELLEELNIEVRACKPWLSIEHDYGDKQVRLHVWQVSEFSGEPTGMQGQVLRWVASTELQNHAFPPANVSIVDKIEQCLAPGSQ